MQVNGTRFAQSTREKPHAARRRWPFATTMFAGLLLCRAAAAAQAPEPLSASALERLVGSVCRVTLPHGGAALLRLVSVQNSAVATPAPMRLQQVLLRFDTGRTALPAGEYCVEALTAACLPATFARAEGRGAHHLSTATVRFLSRASRIQPPYHPPMQVNPSPSDTTQAGPDSATPRPSTAPTQP